MDAVPRELARRARARHVRARAGGSRLASRGGRAGRGAPSRGGPVRAEVAAVLRAAQTTDAIAAIVASPSPAAARVACRSLDALLGIVSAANATRPSAPLIAALATRVAHDPAIADADTALAAASSLRRLATAPGALDDSAVADACAPRAPRRRSRRGWYASPSSVRPQAGTRFPSPRSHRRPSPPRRWRRGATSGTSWRTRVWRRGTTAAALAEALGRRRRRRARAPLRRRRRRHGRRGGAGVETGGVPPGAVSPRGAPRARHRRVRRGGGVSGSGRAISRRVGGVRGGVSRAAAAARDLPAPGDCADWRRVVEALVRAVAAHAECARARGRGRRGRRLQARGGGDGDRGGGGAAPAGGVGSTARPRRPRRRGAPRCSAPASRRRSARARRRGRTRAWRTAVSPRWRTRSGIRGSARSRASGTVGWDSGRRNASGPAPGPRTRGARRSAWRCPARHPRCARKTPRRWRARRS